jgi:hypothetical protein
MFGCLVAAGIQTALPSHAIPAASSMLVVPGFMGLAVKSPKPHFLNRRQNDG